MNPNKIITITSDIEHRFQNFIVFDDTWLRIGEHEIIMRGEEIYETFFTAYNQLLLDDSIKTQIIRHRLDKIANMLRLVKNFDTMILTKFFDRVWKRYYTISENGEHFLDLPLFKQLLPDLIKDDHLIVADRLVKRGSSNDDDDEDNDNSSSNKSKSFDSHVDKTAEEIHA